MPVTSPNMLLTVPNPSNGVTGSGDTGPLYAQEISNDLLTLIDSHDHSAGKGVLVTPAGMNINVDLPFNDNNANTVRSVRFYNQPTGLSASGDISNVYVLNGNLYYNNSSGTPIQLTSGSSLPGGNLAGDATGIAASNIVTSLTGGATGVIVKPSNLTFLSTVTPNISQQPFSSTGPAHTFSIVAQSSVASGSLGGNLFLSSGGGIAGQGVVSIQANAADMITAGGFGISYGGSITAITSTSFTLPTNSATYPYILFTGSLAGNTVVTFPSAATYGVAAWYVDTTFLTFNGHNVQLAVNSNTWGTTISAAGVWFVVYNTTKFWGNALTA